MKFDLARSSIRMHHPNRCPDSLILPPLQAYGQSARSSHSHFVTVIGLWAKDQTAWEIGMEV